MSIDKLTHVQDEPIKDKSRTARLLPVLLLIVALVSYTVQTELASYVQHTLDYKKPYYLFFCTHSGYMLLWPCHLLAFKILKIPVSSNLRALVPLLAQHYAVSPSSTSKSAPPSSATHTQDFPFPLHAHSQREISLKTPWIRHLLRKVALLTIFISFPALSWYASVPLTSMADLTAIYNVFAFWAYLLSLKFLPHESSQTKAQARLKLFAVLLAVSGVFVIAYGDMIWGNKTSDGPEGSNRILGNGLALFGSIAYAGYEVWYKIKIALPEPSSSSDTDTPTRLSETSSLLSTRSSSPAPEEPSPASLQFPPPPSPSLTLTDSTLSSSTLRTITSTPTLFLLYSNLITSLIGLMTFTFLWIPIPLLDYVGWESWEGLPPKEAAGAMVGIIIGGVLFNGSFMILLSLWGPVVASVANLLTLILVALCDALFIPTAPPLTRSSLIGGALIVSAFASLIWGEYGAGEKEEKQGKGLLGSSEDEEEELGYEEVERR